MEKEYLKIGKITSTHGIKGEVKIYVYSGDLENFLSYENLYVGEKKNLFSIEKARVQKNLCITKLQGVNSANDAEAFKNKEIFVEKGDLKELDEDEYLVSDMIGMEIIADDGRIIGKLKDVLGYSANDVLQVLNDEEQEILIPNVKSIVKEIKMDENKIIITPIKGLIPDDF